MRIMTTAKRPWYMFYPLGGMLLLSVIWSGYWYVATSKIKQQLAEQRQILKIRNVSLDCGKETWGGFPFRFEFTCEATTLRYLDAIVESKKLRAVAQAYNPFHILLLIDGPSTVSQRGKPPITATHRDALISIIYDTKGNWDVSSELADTNVQNLFSGTSLKFFARYRDGKIDLAGNADGLAVQTPNNVQGKIDHAEFLARSDALPSDNPSIAIQAIKITSGSAALNAQGNIGMNAAHQLTGKLTVQTDNIDALLKLVAPLVAMKEQDLAAVKSLLMMQGNNPASPLQKAEFTAKDGGLYWGLLKISDLKPVYLR
jgi:hypothetical protein